jgi:hypothetical protein
MVKRFDEEDFIMYFEGWKKIDKNKKNILQQYINGNVYY